MAHDKYQSTEAVRAETHNKVQDGSCFLITWENIKDNPPPNQKRVPICCHSTQKQGLLQDIYLYFKQAPPNSTCPFIACLPILMSNRTLYAKLGNAL
jgi:hypothetical protein